VNERGNIAPKLGDHGAEVAGDEGALAVPVGLMRRAMVSRLDGWCAVGGGEMGIGGMGQEGKCYRERN
jgi:hypothetical protein